MPKMTAKQKMFVKEYLVDLNATQAAIRSGYSETSAQMIGSTNLSKPIIAEAIDKAMDKQAQRTEITADKILSAIAKIGFSEDDSIQTKDKLKGLELLGKHHALFTDKVSHTSDYKGDPAGITDEELARTVTAASRTNNATAKGGARKPH